MNGSSQRLVPRLRPWSIDVAIHRHRIFAALQKTLPRFKGVLLDVGCGSKPYRELVLSPPSMVTQYIGMDLANGILYSTNPDVRWDGVIIPLEDGSVDCALCTEMLEHCTAPDRVLAETKRVLRPGGVLFFTVPFLWPLHDVPNDECRYTPYAMDRHLRSVGFTGIQIEALGGWDASLAQMIGLWARRRPLDRRWERVVRPILSFLAWPWVATLAKFDQRPVTFAESSMITGITGTATKPSL